MEENQSEKKNGEKSCVIGEKDGFHLLTVQWQQSLSCPLEQIFFQNNAAPTRWPYHQSIFYHTKRFRCLVLIFLCFWHITPRYPCNGLSSRIWGLPIPVFESWSMFLYTTLVSFTGRIWVFHFLGLAFNVTIELTLGLEHLNWWSHPIRFHTHRPDSLPNLKWCVVNRLWCVCERTRFFL